jgi:hypothetical protein
MLFSYAHMMTNVYHTVIHTEVASGLLKRVYQHKTKAFRPLHPGMKKSRIKAIEKRPFMEKLHL